MKCSLVSFRNPFVCVCVWGVLPFYMGYRKHILSPVYRTHTHTHYMYIYIYIYIYIHTHEFCACVIKFVLKLYMYFMYIVRACTHIVSMTFELRGLRFPGRSHFAMTINNSLGQTLNAVFCLFSGSAHFHMIHYVVGALSF